MNRSWSGHTTNTGLVHPVSCPADTLRPPSSGGWSSGAAFRCRDARPEPEARGVWQHEQRRAGMVRPVHAVVPGWGRGGFGDDPQLVVGCADGETPINALD